MPDIYNSKSNTPNLANAPEKTGASNNTPLPSKTSLLSHSFSAFHFMPESVRFETQAAGETIILLLRKHWITNLFWLIISFLLILLPLLFSPLFMRVTLPSFMTFSLIIFILLIWYLVTFSYVLVNFLLWYFTVSIVTNERIIDIDYVNILYKKFAETRIARIEDVTERTGGFVKSFFDYGDVYVQTAAKEAEFQFVEIPHPEKVVQIINDLMGKAEDEH